MTAVATGRVMAPDEMTVDEAATYVRAAMGTAVEAIVEVGRRLREVKARVGHGGWLPLFDKDRPGHIPMSERTARMFMQIAGHPDVQTGNTVADLPPSWGTLAVLAALPQGEIARLTEDGSVTPETTRAEAQALVEQINAARQAAFNEYSRMVDGLTAALSYFRGGFTIPADLPDAYVSPAEALERAEAVVAYIKEQSQ